MRADESCNSLFQSHILERRSGRPVNFSNTETVTGFDTLGIVRDLEAAGVERRHAEAMAKAANAGHGGLAAKADLAALDANLETGLSLEFQRFPGSVKNVREAAVVEPGGVEPPTS